MVCGQHVAGAILSKRERREASRLHDVGDVVRADLYQRYITGRIASSRTLVEGCLITYAVLADRRVCTIRETILGEPDDVGRTALLGIGSGAAGLFDVGRIAVTVLNAGVAFP